MKRIATTVGRAIFNLTVRPRSASTTTTPWAGSNCAAVVADATATSRIRYDTAQVVNEIKKVGFEFSTRGGMSIAVADVMMSDTKAANCSRTRTSGPISVERQYRRGLVTEDERLARAGTDLERRRATSSRKHVEERPARSELRLHDGGLWREGKHEPDQPDGRYARSGARPEGRDHRHPDPVELPRGPDGARVLPLHARRAQGSGRHRAAHGGLGVSDPATG